MITCHLHLLTHDLDDAVCMYVHIDEVVDEKAKAVVVDVGDVEKKTVDTRDGNF